jgi:Uma2 family endonuclease
MQAPEVFHARPRQLTRAEYRRMGELGFFQGERVELIHGMVVRMPPIGPSHAEVVDRLNATFVRAVGARARVRIQQPYIAHDESEPEPDVALVEERSYADEHPRVAMLVVEVSETSQRYDRDTKGPLYASSDVAEYWLVDLVTQQIEISSAPVDGRYTQSRKATIADTVSPAAFPDVIVSVAELLG